MVPETGRAYELNDDMDFFGKNVLVMGLGLHGGGVGVTKWLIAQGAHVTVTDLKTRAQLRSSVQELRQFIRKRKFSTALEQYSSSERSESRSTLSFTLGHHSRRDILSSDLIVQNPGVANDSSYLTLARKHKVPITNDTALFFEHCPWPIIGVTGTKGKTTTATLLWHILHLHNKNTLLAGNMRVSPLELLLTHARHPEPCPTAVGGVPPEAGEGSRFASPMTSPCIILELSSWNLEGLSRIKQSPHVAVITNIMPDHLNRYASMRAYIEAKAQIFLYQKSKDILVLNRDNPISSALAKRAQGRVLWFSKRTPLPSTFTLSGEHNQENAAAAITAARALAVPNAIIAKAMRTFKGVAGRQELVATIRGVRYINDTTATTPEATVVALTSLAVIPSRAEGSRRIILIAGGGDKELEYRSLASAIMQSVKALIFFEGTASDKVLRELKRLNVRLPIIAHQKTMRAAVTAAQSFATRGDIILLSPGATSFGLFAHEFDRGDQFVESIRKKVH